MKATSKEEEQAKIAEMKKAPELVQLRLESCQARV
jgi:hypothetical protein